MPEIEDKFESNLSPYWVRFCIGHSNIEHASRIARFVIDGAQEGQLSDAEIDDHRTVPRARLMWKPPLRMTVRARFSHPDGKFLGTAGFGFWNDPFDWVGNVQSPPNALWFFYASPPSDMRFVRRVRGNGWKAAMLNGGKSNAVEMAVGNFVFGLPGMSKVVLTLAESRINAGEKLLDEYNMTDWHTYSLEWRERQAGFFVDEVQVLCVEDPPRVPLGFVAWVDNNCTTMGAGLDFSFRRMAVAQREWMELSLVKIEEIASSSGLP
ncbi:MAG TPA: hypothetical protein VIX58_10975 [Anaerolineae bacterium]